MRASAGAEPKRERVEPDPTRDVDTQQTLYRFNESFRRQPVQSLSRFQNGALPFDDQLRVSPDGLDPVAERRRPTARYNAYDFGDDLATGLGDEGRVRGFAAGQAGRGVAVGQERWEIMPDRSLVQRPDARQPLMGGNGVRSGGRGAPLGSFLGGSAPGDGGERGYLEWERGPTGGRASVDKGFLRPANDLGDRAFRQEDLPTLDKRRGAGAQGPAPMRRGFRDVAYDAQAPGLRGDELVLDKQVTTINPRPSKNEATPTTAADRTAWKFSYDLRQLLDVAPLPARGSNVLGKTSADVRGKVVDPTMQRPRASLASQPVAGADRRTAAPERKVLFSDEERNDFRRDAKLAVDKELDARFPHKRVGAHRGVTVQQAAEPPQTLLRTFDQTVNSSLRDKTAGLMRKAGLGDPKRALTTRRTGSQAPRFDGKPARSLAGIREGVDRDLAKTTQPVLKHAGAGKEATAVEASSAIRSTKKVITEVAMPQGTDAVGGRTVQIKKAGSSTDGGKVGDRASMENDAIAEQAGRLVEPLRPPKAGVPDYAQPTIESMRNAGEFRRR
jgi:hypothetical protein